MKIKSLWIWFFGFAVSLSASSDRAFYLNTTIAPVYLNGEPNAIATVTRQTLTAAELAAEQKVNFALKMRNFDELQARIARGDVLSFDEMTARYFPLRESWQKVAQWASTQGFKVGDEDISHMTVAGTSSVAHVQTVLKMQFARVVGTDGEDYTSAITAPAIPDDFRDSVVGVLQLQPHLRERPNQMIDIAQINEGYILPQTFARLYNAEGLGVDGKNETIVILGGYRVDPSDLVAFWQTCGLPTTIAQFTEIDLSTSTSPGDYGHAGEETMDIEWASAMAPAADIVYLSTLSMDVVSPWIISQLAAGRPIHQVSTSFSGPEATYTVSPATRAARSQYYAALAAMGVTVFVASGDGGSTQMVVNGVQTSRGYDPAGTTSPYYPASDPNVTAVGGTSVRFEGGNQVALPPAHEAAWTLTNLVGFSLVGQPASGGGVSGYFPRPTWQAGPGIPAGTMRCVPDVAALAASNFSPYMQFRGMKLTAAGTSVSAPIWAGLCALMNQARRNEGLPPIGLLGPKIYPLNGTACFNQMTTGSQSGTDGYSSTATNGAYMVGPNYNLVSGLGSPNIGNLILVLTGHTLAVAPSNAVITITVE